MTWTKALDKALTKKLIGLSHPLKPVVVVGRAGPTDPLLEQVRHVQKTHDLIKIRLDLDTREEIQAAAEQLAAKTESILVNRIGKVAVLYKPLPEKPVEKTPKQPPKRRPRR